MVDRKNIPDTIVSGGILSAESAYIDTTLGSVIVSHGDFKHLLRIELPISRNNVHTQDLLRQLQEKDPEAHINNNMSRNHTTVIETKGNFEKAVSLIRNGMGANR